MKNYVLIATWEDSDGEIRGFEFVKEMETMEGAKAFILDLVAEFLSEEGMENYTLRADGPSEYSLWEIGIPTLTVYRFRVEEKNEETLSFLKDHNIYL